MSGSSKRVESRQQEVSQISRELKGLAKELNGNDNKQVMLRVNVDVAKALRTSERDVMTEIEDYLGPIDITSEPTLHQEQFDFALI